MKLYFSPNRSLGGDEVFHSLYEFAICIPQEEKTKTAKSERGFTQASISNAFSSEL